jgi:Ca2+-binding EF-hand superfamily protein
MMASTDFERQLKEHGSKFRALGLSVEQLKSLHQCFTSMDLESHGTLQLHDLLMKCDLERTAFTERVFRALDGDKGGEIDFKEFVVALWNYATLDKNAICAFAYDLYDTDSSGSIDIAEVEQVYTNITTTAYTWVQLSTLLLAFKHKHVIYSGATQQIYEQSACGDCLCMSIHRSTDAFVHY